MKPDDSSSLRQSFLVFVINVPIAIAIGLASVAAILFLDPFRL